MKLEDSRSWASLSNRRRHFEIESVTLITFELVPYE